MAIALPEKIHLKGVEPKDLSVGDKAMYDAYYVEKRRRKDKGAPDVAQEALECYEGLISDGHSSSEAFTEYGYGLRVIDAARVEERRIIAELGIMPSGSVADGILTVAYVRAKHSIPEWAPPVEPLPGPK